MGDNFKAALEYSRGKLEEYREVGLMARFESASKSNSLGVYNETIDWDLEIEKAKEDYDSFVRLKRYCARLIRVGKLEPQFENWLMDYLDDIFQPPPNPKRGAPKKHNDFDVLALLIDTIYKKFKLSPTRNDVSERVSACDVVSEAVLEFNFKHRESFEIKPNSYSALKKLYFGTKAKKVIS